MASVKVETYLADNVYFLEETELIATAKAVALEEIAAAKTEEEIHSARDAFTQTMDGFATKATYVQAAKDELNAYTVGVVGVDLIVSGAISSMELVDSKAELDSLLVAAKTAVDEKRSVSVQAAKDAINAKKASVLFNEYSESNQAVINALYKAAQDAIKNARTQADLDSAVANFISGIDALEKLAPEKESSGKKGGCGSIVGLTTVGVLACAGVALLGKKKED
jgi:replicative DNA helicase